MIKHINGWELLKKLEESKVYDFINFPGSKVRCMQDYVKPLLRENMSTLYYMSGQIKAVKM